MPSTNFRYRRSYKIIYRGCQIYYDPKTKLPTNEITERIKKYTPDFLFRDTRDNKAFLIELKPRAFEKNGEPGLIKEIAENYIRWQQVDWKFKIIYDDEIFLTHAQKEKFNALCKDIPRASWKVKMRETHRRYNGNCINFFNHIPVHKGDSKNDTVKFVKYGPAMHR